VSAASHYAIHRNKHNHTKASAYKYRPLLCQIPTPQTSSSIYILSCLPFPSISFTIHSSWPFSPSKTKPLLLWPLLPFTKLLSKTQMTSSQRLLIPSRVFKSLRATVVPEPSRRSLSLRVLYFYSLFFYIFCICINTIAYQIN